MIEIKTAESCQYDILSLGEVMLRLDPGQGRVRTARQFTAWEGGGEYNVARGLSRCFGMRAALASALVDNEVGHLLETLILAGGVDMEHVQWMPCDGVGRRARNGLNFTESGYGVRPALGTSDRAYSAASQIQPGDIDWDRLFGEQGVRWFHTGGIYAALSETTPAVIREALQSARQHGTVTSYDLNYRDSLWREFGGKENCQRVNGELAPLVDVMIGNEEDFTACLGLAVEGVDTEMSELPLAGFQNMIQQATERYSNLKTVATTLRTVKTANINDWCAVCWQDGQLYESIRRPDLEILDRVGGGDSFASGLIFGFLSGLGPQQAVDYGAAHGALAMTTPGDTSMASRSEVEALMAGKSVRVRR